MKRNKEFDEILNEALMEYSGAAPLSGLEDRVMLRLQDRRRNRGVWLTWSFATALAIALIAGIAWFLPKRYDRSRSSSLRVRNGNRLRPQKGLFQNRRNTQQISRERFSESGIQSL